MDDFVTIDMAFDTAFFERVRHRRLLRMWQVLARSFGAILGVTSVANPRVDSILDKHQRILAGVACGDAAVAEHWLEAHLEEARALVDGSGLQPAVVGCARRLG